MIFEVFSNLWFYEILAAVLRLIAHSGWNPFLSTLEAPSYLLGTLQTIRVSAQWAQGSPFPRQSTEPGSYSPKKRGGRGFAVTRAAAGTFVDGGNVEGSAESGSLPGSWQLLRNVLRGKEAARHATPWLCIFGNGFSRRQKTRRPAWREVSRVPQWVSAMEILWTISSSLMILKTISFSLSSVTSEPWWRNLGGCSASEAASQYFCAAGLSQKGGFMGSAQKRSRAGGAEIWFLPCSGSQSHAGPSSFWARRAFNPELRSLFSVPCYRQAF